MNDLRIAKHAMQRYKERILFEIDEDFETWYKEKNDEKAKINSAIKRMIKESYKTKNEDDNSTCHINADEMVIIIESSGVIITLYKIDFGFDKIANKNILKELVNSHKRLEKSIKIEDKKEKEVLMRRTTRKNQIDSEIEQTMAVLDRLDLERDQIILEKKLSKATQREAEKKLKRIKQQLFQPKGM